MQCPIDQTQLVITERQGVEIDYCPKCRGVWLDRGELDKIIDRADRLTTSVPPARTEYESRETRVDDYRRRERDDDDDDDRHFPGRARRDGDDDDDRYYPRRTKKKRESFLGDLFDFG